MRETCIILQSFSIFEEIDKIMNGKIITLLAGLFFIANFSNADVSLSIQPSPVVAGETANIVINSTEGKAVISKLPEIPGVKWVDTTSVSYKNIMIINGTRYEITSYPFVVNKPGIIKLPSLDITVNKQTLKTASKNIIVTSGPLTDLEKYLLVKSEYSGLKEKVYVGEDLKLKINLYTAESLSASPVEYPHIKLNNVVYNDFSAYNRENNRFAQYPYDSLQHFILNGISYTKTTFFTSFRPLSPGMLHGSASVMCEIILPDTQKHSLSNVGSSFWDIDFPDNSAFQDPFFSRNKRISRLIVGNLPKIQAYPVPPSPANTYFLGLVGKWNIGIKLPDKAKVGEPITLSLNVKGDGSLENLNAPEISFSDFTAYPPEVLKGAQDGIMLGKSSSAKINYLLIPTVQGKRTIDVSFSTFDVNTGSYKILTFKKNIEVVQGKVLRGESAIFGNTQNSLQPSNKQKIKEVDNVILYLKKSQGVNLKIPLWKNNLLLVSMLLFISPLLWIGFELIHFRKIKINNNSALRRRIIARRRKQQILKALRMSSSSEDFLNTVQQDVISYLNDVKGFSPGTTANELIKKLDDPNLASCIGEVCTWRYMPDENTNISDLKKRLIQSLKTFSVFVLVSFVLLTTSTTVFATDNTNSAVDRLMTAYNAGKFKEAKETCLHQINEKTLNATWLYNLGNCYFQDGNLVNALLSYERARRLSPQDSDIIENLNYVRSKLHLPEIYQTKTPLDLIKYFRDSLRPDEWMIALSMGWSLLFFSLILRRFTSSKIWVTMMSIAIFLGLLSIIAICSENSALYNHKNAVIMEKNANVYSLPTIQSSTVDLVLDPGDTVMIEEKLDSWIRIRKGNAEGWVNKKSVELIWPY